jgi:Holliday junction resolvase RusA-like endonuclease
MKKLIHEYSLSNDMENLICKFEIMGKLPSLNDYVTACRANYYKANAMKKKCEKTVIDALRAHKTKKINKYPLQFEITWYEPNRLRDFDNVCFGVKFILDAMVKGSYIPDDSQKYVRSIIHHVEVNKEYPHIEVKIKAL